MAYLRLQSHFSSGVLVAGKVSDPCLPIRLCNDLPFHWFDSGFLDFFINDNVYYQAEADPLVQVGNPNPDTTPLCVVNSFLDADCWRSLGFGSASFWEPAAEIQLYVDPDNYFADPEIRGLCCVELWRCTDDLTVVSPAEICSDPSALMFIQHLPSDLGPAGFSFADPHIADDAGFERLMFCGACGEDDLLATIPSSL